MNNEMNLFNPLDLQLSRSTFHMTPTRTTTCNAGRLIPIFSMPIIPGDSIRMDADTLVKMSTPVYPTMDMLFCDVFFFFVSYDLLLGRRYGSPTINDSNQSWKAIIGAQDNLLNMPVPEGMPEIPSVGFDDDPLPGSLVEYLGYDKGANDYYNCFNVLSYFAIWNENFREPNVQNPVTWSFTGSNLIMPHGYVPLYATLAEVADGARFESFDDGVSYGYLNALGDYVDTDGTDTTSNANHWLPFPVSVFHGYFGSALPWPQRNQEGVSLPLGDLAPVITGEDHYEIGDVVSPTMSMLASRSSSSDPFVVSGLPGNQTYPKYNSQGDGFLSDSTSTSPSNGNAWLFSNLWTDLSQATAANVNALRLAIQQQRFYEKLARSGNRYDELKYGLFGVRSMDSGKDRPLYLGGKRIPLSVEMVASTNGGTDSGDSSAAGSLGQLGAFSHTNDSDHYFYHSFDEWGTLMCLVTIRCHQSYQHGADFHMLARTREDFYFPVFAHLGEQLLKSDIISSDVGKSFGYQQAWEELRQIPDRVGGRLKTDLSFMTYADSFEVAPTLSSFLDASRYVRNVDNTLKVPSYTSGFQFIVQQNYRITARRPLPTYSIPGLMDHF